MAKLSAEQRLAALIEAGMSLASELELTTLLQRVADLSRDVLEAGYAAVGVVAEDGSLSRFVYSGIDEETAEKIGDLPVGRGVLGVLIEEGRPLRLRKVSDHPRSAGFPPNHPPMGAFLGVPIVGRSGIYGRLYATEKQGGTEFSKDDERVTQLLASQAGIAIENARLYEDVRARGEEIRRRVEELASMERVGMLVISEGTLDDVFRSVCREAQLLTNSKRAALLLLDGTTGDLVVAHAEGDDHAADLIGRRLAAGSSKAHGVIQRQRGEVITDMQADPEVASGAMSTLGQPEQGAWVPLMVGERAIGVLAVYDQIEPEDTLVDDDLLVLQIIGNLVAIAIENERLSEALRDLTVLEERERISKELHDGVIQSIYSVGLSLQGTMSLLDRDPARAGERIDGVIRELDNVVRDVRSYIFELQPKAVEERGLSVAMLELVKDFEVNTLAHISTSINEEHFYALSPSTRSHVIQIVREILSNIARHGRAKSLSLTSLEEDGELEIVIEDDGRTYDPDTVERGHGLRNIEQRAASISGTLTISPRSPGGMSHVLHLPSEQAAVGSGGEEQ